MMKTWVCVLAIIISSVGTRLVQLDYTLLPLILEWHQNRKYRTKEFLLTKFVSSCIQEFTYKGNRKS